MNSKLLLLPSFLLATLFCFGQYSNLKFSPEQPKPGAKINFEYSVSGTVLGDVKDFSAIAYLQDGTTRAQEITLTANGDKWMGTILANDSTKAILLVFKKEQLIDNNREQGYTLLMMENNEPVKGAFIALAELNSFGAALAQMKVPQEKNIELYEKEFALNPKLKDPVLPAYASLLMRADKDHAPEKIKTLIDGLLSKRNKTESDYQSAMRMYSMLKDKPNEDKLKAEILKQFPAGNTAKSERIAAFVKETDLVKKEALLNALLLDFPPKSGNDNRSYSSLYNTMANAAAGKNDWELMKKYVAKVTDQQSLASTYNEVAWKLVGEGMEGKAENLEMAKDLSSKSLEYMKDAKKNMSGKPAYMTDKEWVDNLEYTYGNFSDTYGLVLWKMNDFKKAYKAQKEAMEITKRNNTEINERYVVFKEKAEGPGSVKTDIEDFIKEGKSTPKMKESLKKIYLSQKHSEEEYTVYLDGLLKAFREKMRTELLKKMISEAAPSFALKDFNGNTVSLTDMKGKVVVVDFWATWCGPCKASFPGMQTVVNKYKDDPDVKFLFVDTWENKKPDIMQQESEEFIKKNKYSFNVLLDTDNKVVESFAVSGIPTKFVIDPNSNVRFKSVGYGGNADQLVDEMSIMITALKEGAGKKGF